MKISEFLQDFFTITGPTGNQISLDVYELDSKALQIPELQQQLLKCDEFKNTKTLNIVEPFGSVSIVDGKPGINPTKTVLLAEDYIFAETVNLCAISLTPPLYDPMVIYKSVKDDIVISPVIYDPQTSYKFLKINFSVEQSQGEKALSDEEYKEKILKRVKDALDNPKEYTP